MNNRKRPGVFIRYRINRILSVAFLGLICGLPIVAQKPSLSETQSWLKNTLLDKGKVLWNSPASFISIKADHVSFDGCTMKYGRVTEVTLREDNLIVTISDLSRFSLADIDPTSLHTEQEEKTRAWSAVASITDNGMKIEYSSFQEWAEHKRPSTSSDTKKSSVVMQLQDEDTAKKVVKALSDAVSLCGGKKSIY